MLAYTPRPTVRPNVTPMGVACQVRQSRQTQESAGLAAMSVMALSLISSATFLCAPSGSTSAAPVEIESRPFDTRAAAPQPAVEPVVMDARPMSPLPYASGVLGPASTVADGAAALEASVQAPVAVAARERHVLTSFDGTRTMSDETVVRDGAVAQAVQSGANAPARTRYEPVVWNNPLRWISGH